VELEVDYVAISKETGIKTPILLLITLCHQDESLYGNPKPYPIQDPINCAGFVEAFLLLPLAI
jgi:hypothetical protein